VLFDCENKWKQPSKKGLHEHHISISQFSVTNGGAQVILSHLEREIPLRKTPWNNITALSWHFHKGHRAKQSFHRDYQKLELATS